MLASREMTPQYPVELITLHRAEDSLGGGALSAEPPLAPAHPAILTTSYLPDFRKVSVSPALSHGHLLESMLLQVEPLSAAQYKMIAEELQCRDELKMMVSQCGAIPAATSTGTHYTYHSWARDTAIVALAAAELGEREVAAEAVWNWVKFYSSPEQRARFAGFHLGPDPVGAYNLDHMHPHIIASIANDGTLEQREKPWGHQQLESPAWILFSAYNFANQGILDLWAINREIDRRDALNGCMYNKIESLLPLIAKSYLKIEYWRQSDLGVWEDNKEYQRATSIGVVVRALEELHRYHEQHGWDALPVCYDGKNRAESSLQFKLDVEEGIREGRKVLLQRIPDEPHTWANECDNPAFSKDLSLMLLLFPLRLELTENQRQGIYRTLFGNMGELGFVRRWHDAYVGEDYVHAIGHPWGEGFAFMDRPDYHPAEWTIGDPTIAVDLAEESVRSGCVEKFLLADRLMKRSLAHITSRDVSYAFAAPRQESWLPQDIVVPGGSLPEAYFYNQGVPTANHNYSLLWSVAMQACALRAMSKAARQWAPFLSASSTQRVS